jgi:hypothetical protein
MSATLRKAAMDLDIKQKTKTGGRLEFYCVDQAGYDMLTDPHNKIIAVLKGADNVRPLAWLKRQELNQAIDAVNGRYGRGMDYKTHCRYLADLKQATGALLHKLEDDVKAERPAKPKLAPNPFKVGDLITAAWEYSAPKEFENYANARVARVSDTYVWLEVVAFKECMNVRGRWSNTDSAVEVFNNVQHYGKSDGWSNHGHFIPLAGNEEALYWAPLTDYKGRLVRQRWDKVLGYRVKNVGTTAQAGY